MATLHQRRDLHQAGNKITVEDHHDNFALLRVERSVLDEVREGLYVVKNFETPLTPGFLAKLKREGAVYLPFPKESKARGLFNSLVAGGQAALDESCGA